MLPVSAVSWNCVSNMHNAWNMTNVKTVLPFWTESWCSHLNVWYPTLLLPCGLFVKTGLWVPSISIHKIWFNLEIYTWFLPFKIKIPNSSLITVSVFLISSILVYPTINYLPPCRSLEKLTVPELIKKQTSFMEPEGSLPGSQELVTGP